MAGLKEEPSGGGGAPEWVLTYGDMMSLLLTFFIMLAALSEVKKKDEFEMLAEALRRRFGKFVALDEIALYYKPTVATPLKSVSQGREKVSRTLEGASKTKGPQGREARVTTIRPGDEATTGGVIFFKEGSDEPEDTFREKIAQIAKTLSGKPQKIEVRGHTSPRPLAPGSPFRSHWDLAYAECLKVMEGLIAAGIEPERIRISIAAANEPLWTDPDPEKRPQNARVEVSLLNELARDLKGSSTP